MLRVLLAACLLLMAAGCGDASAPTTTTVAPGPAFTQASPADAVERLFAAVSGADGAATALLVPDAELIAIVATENDLSAAEIAALVRAGVPTELRQSYWGSFADSFEEFAGLSLGDLEVEQVTEYSIGPRTFAAVEIAFPTRIGSAYLVTAKDEPGGWHVDLVASLAPSLLRPIRTLLTNLPADEDGDVVRQLFTDLVPSLLAAAESPVDDQVEESVRREIEALVRFVSPGLS